MGDLEKRKRKKIKPQPNKRFVERDEIEKAVCEAQEASKAEQAANASGKIILKLNLSLPDTD